MKKTSIPLLEFQKRYQTEDACLAAIVQMRWPKGFVCPGCGYNNGYRLHKRRAIECSACRHQTSITAGTIFHKTRISLVNWFWMIFLVAQDKGGASASRIARLLGMHYDTVWHILHKIRKAMTERDKQAIRLGGIIELDEGFFGGHKRKVQVLVMIEKAGKEKSGNLIMRRIPGRVPSGPDVEKAVASCVDNESKQHFISDGAWAHQRVKKMGHSLEMYNSTPETVATKLPWVHIAIMLFRQFVLGTYHGVSRKYLQNYLGEFCFRFNRRSKEQHLYESLLRACILNFIPALT